MRATMTWLNISYAHKGLCGKTIRYGTGPDIYSKDYINHVGYNYSVIQKYSSTCEIFALANLPLTECTACLSGLFESKVDKRYQTDEDYKYAINQHYLMTDSATKGKQDWRRAPEHDRPNDAFTKDQPELCFDGWMHRFTSKEERDNMFSDGWGKVYESNHEQALAIDRLYNIIDKATEDISYGWQVDRNEARVESCMDYLKLRGALQEYNI